MNSHIKKDTPKKKLVKPLVVLPPKSSLPPKEPTKKSNLVDDNKGCINQPSKE